MNLFYQPGIPEGTHYLDPEESKHVSKVLRKKQGDHIRVTDGRGVFYECSITRSDPGKTEFAIVDQWGEKTREYFIHIAIAPTKNPDRIEWFVEKAVEIGVDEITFIECEHSERSHFKIERITKIAISAMKQSLKASIPKISPIVPLRSFIVAPSAQQRFIAYVDDANPSHLKDNVTRSGSYVVLIGPEGDFSQEELAMAVDVGFQKVSLGPSRLRTETAALAACHILNLANQ